MKRHILASVAALSACITAPCARAAEMPGSPAIAEPASRVLEKGAAKLDSGAPAAAETATAEAAENKVSYSYETDFNSRYVYRGLALSEGPVIQPGVYAALHGYTLGLWGNINASRRPGPSAGPRQLNEVDLSLVKSIEHGKTTLEPSALFYLYPTSISPTTGEVSLKLSHGFRSFSLYTSHTVDFAKYSGAYFAEIGLEKEREFLPRWSGTAKLSLGAGNGTFNEANIGPRKPALDVAALDLSLTRTLGPRLYLRPHLGLTHILNGELRAALEDPALLSVGLAVGGEF